MNLAWSIKSDGESLPEQESIPVGIVTVAGAVRNKDPGHVTRVIAIQGWSTREHDIPAPKHLRLGCAQHRKSLIMCPQ